MKKEDICPVVDTLEFFNRKWILCILMDMFRGNKHFSEFQESNPSLNNFTLAQTLKYMEQNDLIIKIQDENNRLNTEYVLTRKGKKVNKILYEMTLFSLEELKCSKLSSDKKEEILREYEESLKIS